MQEAGSHRRRDAFGGFVSGSSMGGIGGAANTLINRGFYNSTYGGSAADVISKTLGLDPYNVETDRLGNESQVPGGAQPSNIAENSINAQSADPSTVIRDGTSEMQLGDIARTATENGYPENGPLSAEQYVQAVREAYQFGQKGMRASLNQGSGLTGKLDNTVRIAAYHAGKAAGGDQIAADMTGMQLSDIARKAIEDGYQKNGPLSAEQYVQAVREAYQFGQKGMRASLNRGGGLTGKLDKIAALAAYNAGKVAEQAQRRERRNEMIVESYKEFPNDFKNSSSGSTITRTEMFKKEAPSRAGFTPLSKSRFDAITAEAKSMGIEVVRGGEEIEEHLRKNGAVASIFGKTMVFSENICLSDVLEELYHYKQNMNGLNDREEAKLRTILNEIDAKEYLLSVAKKYKIPRVEQEHLKAQLESYKKELAEY